MSKNNQTKPDPAAPRYKAGTGIDYLSTADGKRYHLEPGCVTDDIPGLSGVNQWMLETPVGEGLDLVLAPTDEPCTAKVLEADFYKGGQIGASVDTSLQEGE